MICGNIFTAPPRPNGVDYRLCYNFKGDTKSQRAFKSHYWFKIYGNFAELVDFAFWWSVRGEGSASAACAAGLLIN